MAAALSLVVPGMGQWYLGRRRRALVFFVPAIGFLVAAILLWRRGEVFLLGLLVQPRWVWVLMVANVAAVAVRTAAVVDAYALARRHGERASLQSRARFGLVGAVIALVLVPHLVVGVYAAELLDLLNTVFVTDDQVAAASSLAVEEEAARARLEAEQARIEREAAAVSSTTVPEAVPPTSAAPPGGGEGPPPSVVFADAGDPEMEPFEDRVDRITVLLAGGDAGPGRWSLRTDVMIVATLDLIDGRATLFSVQRFLSYFPLPTRWAGAFRSTDEDIWEAARAREEDGTSLATRPVDDTFQPCDCYPRKVNGLWTFTNWWTKTFPDVVDPGMEALRETLELAMGIPIHYYALVDMGGFVDLIDAIGGVDIAVREPMHVRFSPAKEGEDWIVIQVEPGTVHLDGRLALAYVRNRSDSNDDVRTRRQRCLLRDVAANADPLKMLRSFPAISDAIKSSTTTNIPLGILPDLIEVVAGLERSEITTLALTSSNVARGVDYRGLPIVDVDRMRTVVGEVLAGEGSAHHKVLEAEECS